MRSAGMAKIAIAFTIGVGLALAGAGLYTRLASHTAAAPVEQTAATAAPGSDGPDKLPDDDTQATASTSTAASAPAPAQQPTVSANPKPVLKTAKRRVEGTHGPVRRTSPVLVKKRQSPAERPQLIAQVKPSAPNPYTTDAAAPPAVTPQPEAPPPVTPQPEPPPIAPQAAAEPIAQPRQPRTMTIPSGTRLTIRLNQALSSDHNFAGDTFQGTLESPIILNDALIAERGSRVVGKVVNVQRGGHGDAGSDLSITLTQINTTDGQRVAVQTSIYDQQTKRNGQRDAEKVGGGAALGAIIGAIAGGGKGAAIGAGVGGAAGGGDVLLSRGHPAVLQAETQVGFQTTAPLTITERLNN